MSLKLATEADRSEYLRMCEEFYRSSPFFPEVSFSPTKTEEILDLALLSKHSAALVLLYTDDNQAHGMLVAIASATPFSDDIVASELAWWVDPEYRGRRSSHDLVLAYEEWAKRIGADHVSMALLPQLTNPKIEGYYERLGFKKTEISYIKAL